jgi:sugar lactone lactonase YvrE
VNRIALLAGLLTLQLYGATSTAWQISGFNEFQKGRLIGLSLGADGILQPGPSLHWNTALNQPALWDLVQANNGIYVATGHRGQVFHVSFDGKSTLVWSAEQAEVFALYSDGKGAVYAGSSPNGGIYRIDGGKAREVWHSPAKYIWSVRGAPDGTLYVATGDQGRIYRVDPSRNTGEVYYETGQSNVTALALGLNAHVYAGTDPNGLLYDISGPKKGRILFDSTLPEMRAVTVGPQGDVYAAGMGGAVSSRTTGGTATTSASPGIVTATTPTVITVTASESASENAQAGAKTAPEQTKSGTSSTATAAATTSGVVEVSGVEKSAIYHIRPNGVVETLRSSKEDNVYALLLDGDDLLFSTDDHGRIYRLTGRKTTLLAETGAGEATRLLKYESTLYSAMSNPARLMAYDVSGNQAGSYESVVHDSTSVAHWGHLQWHGIGDGVVFRTRTGNSLRPDATWSDWSAPIRDSGGSVIQSPPARYVQWRAEWKPGSTAQIYSVDVPYLPQNAPPNIRSVTVSAIVSANNAKNTANSPSSSTAYSITVTDTGEAPAATTSTGNAGQTVSRLQTSQTQISWQADDPDGDKLVYSVYFRSQDGTHWQLIRSRMFENTLLLDPDVFADGRYLFRVVASDAPSNSTEYAHQTELVSTPVLIDNTPPAVTVASAQRNGGGLDVVVTAADTTSPLRLCEFSVDAGTWQPIEAVDGITDSPKEEFRLHLDRLSPEEHLVVFRVYDSANNPGLARVLVR